MIERNNRYHIRKTISLIGVQHGSSSFGSGPQEDRNRWSDCRARAIWAGLRRGPVSRCRSRYRSCRSGWLHGFKVVTVAMGAQAVLLMMRSLGPDRDRATLVVVAAAT